MAKETRETLTLIDIEQRIIEYESDLELRMFLRRLARIWLFGLIPLMILALVAGNVLIDFSKPGNGRGALNYPLSIALIISTLVAPPCWWTARDYLRSTQVELKQHQALREKLLPRAEETGPLPSVAFRDYRDDIPHLLDGYRRAAEKYRSRHNLFQISVIVGSILTSVATTASAEQGVWSWLAVGLSSIVSISAGVISYFKFRERSTNLQQTADSIDQEVQAFNLGIRRYKNLIPEQAAAAFAEEIERIKEEQRKRELQLEQPPEVQQNEGSGSGNRATGQS
ncbi:DUF4231 domain-containing protein [Streptomyces indicus]|uniref:SMODS and SLOG-associating 2TM effector domain-containing protein n=1 Tax=Streptomyces indicus TaxID=417292 RepID=A0A1G8WJF5_9ACTN|nr:DUF4231 domain-containing protein [Streptomyces indicus]SDJ77690.1 Protein of unknown function [Streptomyces indicus]